MQSEALNEKYRLVSRTGLLIAIGFGDAEQSFFRHTHAKNAKLEVQHMLAKLVLDIVLMEGIVYTYLGA